MTGNIGNVSEQTSIALNDIDQIAAHFRTGNGFAIDLEARGLERKGWHQSGLNAVGESEFGLHADTGQTLVAEK